MIRRLHLAALTLLATIALSFAQVGQIPAWPPISATATACSDTSLHTITATGPGSVTTPSGCGHLAVGNAWGGGGSGDYSSTAGQLSGGGGACFAGVINISVVAGVTVVYWNVGLGGAAKTSNGAGSPGTGSWINAQTNAQPASSAVGAFASLGSGGTTSAGGPGCLTSASIGTTLFGGGTGDNGSVNGGGGGGGGSTGAGTTATSATGGAGGTPDGGAGGNGTTPTAGAQPGGGGGAKSATTSGAGGNGQVAYKFAA